MLCYASAKNVHHLTPLTCFTGFTEKNVLVIASEPHSASETEIEQLESAGMKITCNLRSLVEIYHAGPSEWLRAQMGEADCVIIIPSWCVFSNISWYNS